MRKDNRLTDSCKALWHMNRIIKHFDEGERISPIHIDMGLSKFCNSACVYCYGLFQKMEKGVYIQRDALFNFLKDAGEIGVKSVSMIGDGEPTCNPNFYDALYVGKKAGLSLATSTNGVLLNTLERRKAILDNCEWMKFTIGAGTREGYKLIHQRDHFNKVVENIEAMVEMKKHTYKQDYNRLKKRYNCEIGMQTIFVPTLMTNEIVEEAKLAIKLGVDYFLIKQCCLPDKGQSGMMQFDLNDYDKPEIQKALHEAESLSTDKTQIIVKWGLIDLKGKKNYNHCPAIPLLLQISGNGDVYPCGHMFGNKKEFLKYKMGNLHKDRFKDIIKSDKYWNIIKEMRYNFNVKDCGGCRHDRLNEFLDEYLDTPKGRNFI